MVDPVTTFVVIAQGLAVIGTLGGFTIKLGRLIEKIEGHETRITRLENRTYGTGGQDEQSG